MTGLVESLLIGCFWFSAGAVVFAYAGYPALLYVLSRLFGRDPQPPSQSEIQLPRLALLIAAHNEEAVIEQRILNALALDYPRNRLEIAVASDGSEDGTVDIVRRYVGRVRLLDCAQRRGKAATLNAAVAELDADVLVLSDANTFMQPQSLRNLARWFQDRQVGVVCGRLVLRDPSTGRNVDSLYWRYETFLKKCESRLGALLGANGAIYAIRRGLFEPIPCGTIVDDFVIPLAARRRSDCRIVYDCDAVAHEETAPDMQAEFRRRTRIGAGGYQAIGMLWPLLSPHRGWIALSFLCHKVLRWLCPFFLLVCLLANASLWHRPAYLNALFGQLSFYALGILGATLPHHRNMRLLRIVTLFIGMNLALLLGFFRWLRGNQRPTWQPTERRQRLAQAA